MTLKMIAPVLALLLLAACDGSDGDGSAGGAPPETTFNACDAAYPGVPRVVAAYLKRIERAHGGPELTDPLLADARAAVDDPEVELARELHAGDHLIRGYLAPFVEIAGVAPADWLDMLPGGELTAEQVSEAGARALVLVRGLRAGLPATPWVAAYDAIASERHAAIHYGIPGVPSGWYGSDSVFRVSWDAALVAGFQAGEDAWQAAPKNTEEEQRAAMGAAIQATLGANADVFAQSVASTIAEARALIAMR